MPKKFACGCVFETNGDKICFTPDIEKINLNCPATWELIASGNTKGCFQMESQLVSSFAKKLKPSNIEHLAALISIVRPGVLEAELDGKSLTQHFIDRKNGEEEIVYYHEAMKPALKDTLGVILYQESIMKICTDIAGFDLNDNDTMRKSVGKKKPELMAKLKDKFINGAVSKGLTNETQAKQIFEWIEKSQRYSFNKCVSGDTVLFRPHSHKYPYTVEHMYKVRNDIEYAKSCGQISLYKKWKLIGSYGTGYSLNADGRIRPNIIKDIHPSGEQLVNMVILSNGATIKVTDNHKFPTANGIKKLEDLEIGDELYFKLPYEKDNGKRYGFSDVPIPTLREIEREHDHKTCGFMSGEHNPGYTNGAYKQWKENRKLLTNECGVCGKDKGRMEVHHINGDRTNSKLDNLIKLCVSCHKKVEYENGRVKWGEKGYPSELVKITDIIPLGVEQTYDVTMEAPNHNFVVQSGIVTCNSHAVSYALMGYLTAYCKSHFPKQFFTSYLYYAEEKIDPMEEIRALVNNAKQMGLEVYPPDFRKQNEKFKAFDDGIYFGLADIKGVGVNVVNAIKIKLEEYQNWREFGWLEFLVSFSDKIKIDAFRAMISVGAFSWFAVPRTKMLYELDTFSKLTARELKWVRQQNFASKSLTELWQLLNVMWESPTGKNGAVASTKRKEIIASMIALLREPPHSLDDSPTWIAVIEEQLLGIALTCTKIDESKKAFLANCSCKEFLSGKGGNVALAVKVDGVREITTKNGQQRGKKMAFLNVSDQTGSLDSVVLFAQQWEQFKRFCVSDNLVMISGKKDKKQGGLIVEKVYQI